jgi:hypothetical protein
MRLPAGSRKLFAAIPDCPIRITRLAQMPHGAMFSDRSGVLSLPRPFFSSIEGFSLWKPAVAISFC